MAKCPVCGSNRVAINGPFGRCDRCEHSFECENPMEGEVV